MVVLPDIVRAPPERVWSVLVDPKARASGHRPPLEATTESGREGEPGFVASYRGRRRSWRETLVEARRGELVRFDLRETGQEPVRAHLDWNLQPIQMGTLVVLEVRAPKFAGRLLDRYVFKRRYRKLVEGVKRASEGEPASQGAPPGPAATEPEAPSPPAAEAEKLEPAKPKPRKRPARGGKK